MRATKVLLGVDDNPTYAAFWPIVSRFWRERIGIEPVLLRVTSQLAEPRLDAYGQIITLPVVAGISTALQAQVVRMYGTGLFPDETCLISDLDMLPLSRGYFHDNLQPYGPGQLVVFSGDAYDRDPYREQRCQMCYVAGLGRELQTVFRAQQTFADFVRGLAGLQLGWQTDEYHLGRCLKAPGSIEVVRLSRGFNELGLIDRDRPQVFNPVARRVPRRIDRGRWVYLLDLIACDYYVDAHLPRGAEFPRALELVSAYDRATQRRKGLLCSSPKS